MREKWKKDAKEISFCCWDWKKRRCKLFVVYSSLGQGFSINTTNPNPSPPTHPAFSYPFPTAGSSSRCLFFLHTVNSARAVRHVLSTPLPNHPVFLPSTTLCLPVKLVTYITVRRHSAREKEEKQHKKVYMIVLQGGLFTKIVHKI